LHLKIWIVPALSLFLITGCATPIREQTRASIQTIGVVNEFPEYPNYLIIGTTVFSNSKQEVPEPTLRAEVTTELIRMLSVKGYKAESVADGDSREKYDLILELVPRDLYGLATTNGFGFFNNFFLGLSLSKESYVALNLVPKIDGRSTCAACYAQSRSDLAVETMPASWGELSDDEKRIYIDSLRANMKSALSEVVREAGL